MKYSIFLRGLVSLEKMKAKRFRTYILLIVFILCGGIIVPGRAETLLPSGEDRDSVEMWMPADSVFARFLASRDIPVT